jgi:hypothetical protein
MSSWQAETRRSVLVLRPILKVTHDCNGCLKVFTA